MTSDSGVSPVTTVIDLRGHAADGLTRQALDGVLPRAALDVESAVDLVKPITEDVRVRGGAAVREYTRRFDGVDLAHTRVPREALRRALDTIDPKVRDALEEAARRARVVHEAQVPGRADTAPAQVNQGGYGTCPAVRSHPPSLRMPQADRRTVRMLSSR